MRVKGAGLGFAVDIEIMTVLHLSPVSELRAGPPILVVSEVSWRERSLESPLAIHRDPKLSSELKRPAAGRRGTELNQD
jgi:hypothetical protein